MTEVRPFVRDGEARPLRPSLENEVEGRRGRAADTRETRLGEHGAEPPLTGLRAESRADFLRERRRSADQRRHRVEEPADGVQVLLDAIAREVLDEEPRAVGRQRLAHVARRADGIAHVVETVEERDDVPALGWEILRGRDLEPYAIRDAGLPR